MLISKMKRKVQKLSHQKIVEGYFEETFKKNVEKIILM